MDPLFKKTSADFDEGGAGGILMNHLALGGEGGMKVVFDAGDARIEADGEDGDDQEAKEDEEEELGAKVDLSALRGDITSSRVSSFGPY